MSIRWTDDEYAAWKAKIASRPPVPPTDAQRHAPAKSQRPHTPDKVDQKFRVRITHQRRRLADPGGLDYKPVIDGITKAGIWPDDSSRFITEIRETQEKATIETTVIEIFEVTGGPR